MKALYSTYGKDDILILVGRKKSDGIKVVKESEFKLTDDIENGYIIFAYTDEHNIFNNGIRHIYEVKIEADLSNVKVFYKDNEVSEVGVFTDKYIRAYKKYNKVELENDINKSIVLCSRFFCEKLEEIDKNNFSQCEILYFYDGEELEFTLYLNGEEELEIPINYEYLEEIKIILSSIKKDDKIDDYEILNYILLGINKNIKGNLEKLNIKSLGLVECD